MALDSPSQETSALISGILFLLTLSAQQLYANVLASSKEFTIIGGFVGSLLFFFSVIGLGNVTSQVGWVEVLLCELVAVIASANVHRVSATTCILFSVAMLFWINTISKTHYRTGLKKSS